MNVQELFDLSHLNPGRLEELYGLENECPGLLSDLFQIFNEEGPKRFSAMHTGLKNNDRNLISRSARTFCSTCHNVAAVNLASLMKRIESLSLDNDSDMSELASLIAEAEDGARKVHAVLSETFTAPLQKVENF